MKRNLEKFIKESPRLSTGEYRLVIESESYKKTLTGYIYPFGFKDQRMAFKIKKNRIIVLPVFPNMLDWFKCLFKKKKQWIERPL